MESEASSYEAARSNFVDVVTLLHSAIIKFDPTLADLDARKAIFRLHRDIRFSKDKTPYKTYFGASLKKGGKQSSFAGYYLHIEPGNASFVGGGIWRPDADGIKKIRQEIDYNSDNFINITSHKNFKKVFGDLVMDDETSLKREPKGFDKNHPLLKYVKLKSWILNRPLSDKEISSPDFIHLVTESFRAAQPLVHFFNAAIATDES